MHRNNRYGLETIPGKITLSIKTVRVSKVVVVETTKQ